MKKREGVSYSTETQTQAKLRSSKYLEKFSKPTMKEQQDRDSAYKSEVSIELLQYVHQMNGRLPILTQTALTKQSES